MAQPRERWGKFLTLTINLFVFPWQLLDLNSTNGILHNGIRVSEVQLSDGDIITFGGGKSTELNAPPAPEV